MKIATFATVLMLSSAAVPFAAAAAEAEALKDASAIQKAESKETGQPAYSPGQGVNFKPSDHVFVKSALAVDFTYRNATVTLPLFRGLSPLGKNVFYIITDASDFEVARRMGINYAPKLAAAKGSPGVQNVALQDGIMKFAGNVDFSTKYQLVAGDPPGYFPPKVANPGGVADDQWSSIVVLPSGLVLNAQIVQSDSGTHDRVKAIDTKARTVTLSILDGVSNIFIILSPTHRPPSRRCWRKASSPRSWRKFRSSENLCRRKSRRYLASRRYLMAAPIRAPERIKGSLPRSLTASIRSMSFRPVQITIKVHERTTIARYGMHMSACGRKRRSTPERRIASTQWTSRSP